MQTIIQRWWKSILHRVTGVRKLHRQRNLEICSTPDLWRQYFDDAEPEMRIQWDTWIWPMIRNANFTNVLEIGPGAGRNTAMLATMAKTIQCVDLNEYPLELCRTRFADHSGPCKITFHRNDGLTSPMIADRSISLIYSWDAMVHCSKEVLHSYLAEFARVMRPGGIGFIHHSNLGTASPDLMLNTHYRAPMTKELFAEYCEPVGLRCIEQRLITWGGVADLDCMSLFTTRS